MSEVKSTNHGRSRTGSTGNLLGRVTERLLIIALDAALPPFLTVFISLLGKDSETPDEGSNGSRGIVSIAENGTLD